MGCDFVNIEEGGRTQRTRSGFAQCGAHGPAFIARAYPSWVPHKFELSGEQLDLCIAIAIATRIFSMVAIAA